MAITINLFWALGTVGLLALVWLAIFLHKRGLLPPLLVLLTFVITMSIILWSKHIKDEYRHLLKPGDEYLINELTILENLGIEHVTAKTLYERYVQKQYDKEQQIEAFYGKNRD